MKDGLEILSVGTIFTQGHYRVPIYQRAYAWGRDEIETLFRDVRDYRRKGADAYYLGSLVVHERRDAGDDAATYDVVDGQQRLTTLYLTMCHLQLRGDSPGSAHGQLSFEGRDSSTSDLDLLARGISDPLRLRDEGIKEGYRTVGEVLDSEDFGPEDITYLLQHVHVVRTQLPSDTDLNHYFEIMNSRGEQLEKHEIVKAKLMSRLHRTSRDTFATVWDACSDLSKYVQAKFVPAVRYELFGKQWADFEVSDFAQVKAILTAGGPEQDNAGRFSTLLTDLIAGGATTGTSEAFAQSDDESGRYGAIIDFPNFLLHALKLHRGQGFGWGSDDVDPSVVSLDDKQLIDQFENLTAPADIERFAFTLLRLRYLFDLYVIKTDKYADSSVDDSNWVLQRVHRTGSRGKWKLSPVATFEASDSGVDGSGGSATGAQRQVLTAQAMFQVTDSRRAYKNFLYGILAYLHGQPPDRVDGGHFAEHLRTLARDRYLHLTSGGTGSDLDRGTGVPHFVFNYLDYLLWHRHAVLRTPLPAGMSQQIDIEGFRFRYRTSVEHFYPQHVDESQGHEQLDATVVDQFGNLCLMTRSDNSGRSNLMPDAKIKQYDSSNQSLKFQFMAALANKDGTWRSTASAANEPGALGQIERHGRAMRDVLAADGDAL